MNTENEKRLDDLFKKKLDDPVDEIRYEEGDWDALEEMLGKPKRKGISYLWPILSGIAAMLLLLLGWWAFRPKNGDKSTKDQVQMAVQRKTADTTVNGQATAQPKATDTAMNKEAAAGSKAQDQTKEQKAVQQPLAPVQKTPYNVNYALKNKNQKPVLGLSPGRSQKDTIVEKRIGIDMSNNRVDAELMAINAAPVFNPGSMADQQVKQIDLHKPAYSPTTGPATAKNSNKVKPKAGFRPQYALSVVAAPDLNGVGSFQQSKVGTNIGMTFAVGVSRKLTISTGALYSVKPYITNFNNYNTGAGYKWAVEPLNVTADCRMLDIPLNVGYQVYHKRQDKISIGTGLSSYLMLHESYKFTYQYGGSTGPLNYTVPNPGKYFFGIVNLNATYERQINSKVGISVQPYMKLPLSNVGYSQVKLQTTGVAVGLSWNLNSLTKP
ncbi:hypothetical protein [Mucilaginibacter sp. OK098]|uniref:hypothetical protein n=1 Tax=Mucilaginibacter sp. OK098 TaxID=1855297 RepID=UPI0009199937|nr:hypothetical protein [Mucilaginibacter sp. OK098]SHN27784.1 hypothetical protein SAMN05216524_10875 [Mucilaginibacter sp. OK098]